MNRSTGALSLRIEQASSLGEYASVPIAYEVTARLALPLEPEGPHRFKTLPVERYVHDYDRLPGQSPSDWAARWDLRSWRFLAAYLGGRRIGGAALILDSTQVEGRPPPPNSALLWDLRVRPDCRGRGVGSKVLAFAEAHAAAQGVTKMRVETQDNNTAACRLYARAGYALVGVDPHAYPDVPGQVQLMWEKALLLASDSRAGQDARHERVADQVG